jgi:hypothetical protein
VGRLKLHFVAQDHIEWKNIKMYQDQLLYSVKPSGYFPDGESVAYFCNNYSIRFLGLEMEIIGVMFSILQLLLIAYFFDFFFPTFQLWTCSYIYFWHLLISSMFKASHQQRPWVWSCCWLSDGYVWAY